MTQSNMAIEEVFRGGGSGVEQECWPRLIAFLVAVRIELILNWKGIM